MEINKLQNHNLASKGLQAQKLKGFFVVDKNLAAYRELKALTPKTGLDIFTPDIASKSIKKEYATESNAKHLLWGQDFITFLPLTKVALFEAGRDHLKRIMRATADGAGKALGYRPIKVEPHIRGGNFFIVQNNGQPELLIHKGKAKYPQDQLQLVYTAAKVHEIPELDYHLDLFIRPLKDNIVLVADENKTMETLETGLAKVRTYITNNELASEEIEIIKKLEEKFMTAIGMMEITQKHSPYKPLETTEEVVQTLENAGFKAIRVPANYYKLENFKNKDVIKTRLENFKNNMAEMEEMAKYMDGTKKQMALGYIQAKKFLAANSVDSLGNEFVHSYKNNFINAIVTEKDGELVYITNGSLLDEELGLDAATAAKIGFSTKQAFIDSISPYVKKENIHFISENTTRDLFKYYGGIHCVGAEVV